MARFLSWATDVLEAVDQSAATISQKDSARRRRRGGPLDAATSDGHFSDTVPSEEEGAAGQALSPAGYASDSRRLSFVSAAASGDTLADFTSPLPKPTPIASLGSSRRYQEGTPGSLASSVNPSPVKASPGPAGTPASASHVSTQGLGSSASLASLDPGSALFAAKSSSPALAKLRAVRRTLDGRVWADEGLKAQYEEELRKASEAEAKVSLMSAEVEKLRASASRAAAAHAQEKETLEQELRNLRAALQKDTAAFATENEEWEMRKAELQEESAAYEKALANIQRQMEERVKETEHILRAAGELEQEAAALDAAAEQEGVTSPTARGQSSEADGTETGEEGEEEEEEDEDKEVGGEGAEGGYGERGGEGSGAEVTSRRQAGVAHELGEQEGSSLSLEDRQHSELSQATAENLEFWEERARALEEELKARMQAASTAPSPAQREKDLQRRLRTLGEQLVMKQNQAEELASDVQALRVRLSHILQQRAQLRAVEEQFQELRAGARLGGPGRVGRRRQADRHSMRSFPYEGPDTPGRERGRLSKAAVFQKLLGVTRGTVDTVSYAAGAVLSRSLSARMLLVAYVFCLHFVVLVILSLAAGSARSRKAAK